MGTLAASFRVHRQSLEDADNGVMALLFGAQFSASSLELARGSNVILARVFPMVPNIERFNLRPDVARERLLNAEAHLARIAIPYALSVHEDYLLQVKNEVEGQGVAIALKGRAWNAENMHSIMFDTLGISPLDTSEFDYLRRIRNSLIHQAGLVDQYLIDGANRISASGGKHWEKVTLRPPLSVVSTKNLDVGTGEVMLAFSIVRHLSSVVHSAMLKKLSKAYWRKECVTTFLTENQEVVQRRLLLRTRLTSWANTYYDDFGFKWPELKKQAIGAGVPMYQLRLRGER